MAFRIVTDIEELDEYWKAGILYVCPKDNVSDGLKWVLDTSPGSVSKYLEGWKLQPNGSWVPSNGRGITAHITWAVQVEE